MLQSDGGWDWEGFFTHMSGPQAGRIPPLETEHLLLGVLLSLSGVSLCSLPHGAFMVAGHLKRRLSSENSTLKVYRLLVA